MNTEKVLSWSDVRRIFLIFFRLGLTSFGGPMAHLAYFRTEFVERRKWLGDAEYADLVVLCQVLPGPASSQVGIALGFQRGRIRGALAAWLGFTLPSAVFLALFAAAVMRWNVAPDAPWLHGLKIVSVAVVAQAIVGMRRTLAPEATRLFVVAASATVAFLAPGLWSLFLPLLLGIAAGCLLPRRSIVNSSVSPPTTPSKLMQVVMPTNRLAGVSLALLAVLLISLPIAASLTDVRSLGVFAGFFQAGALVFGGGHVVLPLLQSLVVSQGWVSQTQFTAAYGAAQAVPGPLFTLTAALGAFALADVSLVWGALIGTVGIFLPALLLVLGTLPFWDAIRNIHLVRRVLAGVNAAVLGLLVASFVNPICSTALHSFADVAFAAACYAALVVVRIPPWGVVTGAAFLPPLFTWFQALF